MSHVRDQIRKAVAARLAERVESVAGRVFSRRNDPAFKRTAYPALIVIMGQSKTSDYGSSSAGPSMQRRSHTIEVRIVDIDDGDTEARLEDFAVEVEAAFKDWRKLPIDLVDFTHSEDVPIDFGATQDGELVGMAVQFTATCLTQFGAADTSILKG